MNDQCVTWYTCYNVLLNIVIAIYNIKCIIIFEVVFMIVKYIQYLHFLIYFML